MPYLQIKSIRVRDSKFGPALVVETSRDSGGYILGFRIDPEEQLQAVHQELVSLHKVYSASPVFGVEFTVEEQPQSLEAVTMPKREDDVEIVANGDEMDGVGDTFAAYYADADKTKDREPEFNADLGLAVEQLREGLTVKQLWALL
mmetsp:Transcript_18075/g.60502  ORF Transcript_18075/g.60502 Transcript_18075/m.60502 type:complete len:146 (+) Transcript_18075:700-1137(+)